MSGRAQVTGRGAGRAPVWRLVLGDRDVPEPADGPTNMALDRALLESMIGQKTPVLRLYRWAPATLSFGRNQPARGLYDESAAAARGIGFVRRPTGGQAVLHDDELTYAVAAPLAAIGKPRLAYRRINQALVVGLRSLGLEASVAGGADGARDGSADEEGGREAAVPPDWAAACFRRPERGEVVVRGRKLVGSAQRVEHRAILQHGSILLGGSQAAAEELLAGAGILAGAGAGLAGQGAGRAEPEGAAAAAAGWTTVSQALGRRPGPDELVDAVVAGFGSALGISLAPSGLTPEEVAAAAGLRERFASRDWTWRR